MAPGDGMPAVARGNVELAKTVLHALDHLNDGEYEEARRALDDAANLALTILATDGANTTLEDARRVGGAKGGRRTVERYGVEHMAAIGQHGRERQGRERA